MANQDPPETTTRGGNSRRRFLATSLGVTGGLAAFDGLFWEPRNLEVVELSMVLPKVPPGRELRLVHLSDLHINRFNRYFRQVAEQAMQLRPDIILLTGDYLEEQRNLFEVRSFLEMLEAPQGIFAVQGNWEYWSRLEGENLRQKFSASGVQLLINQRQDLEIRDVPLTIHGLDYPSGSEDLVELEQQADVSRVNLLLSHVPAFSHHLLCDRFDLIFSGHTHGGQVRLPFVPPFYLPRYSGQFVAGLYRVGPQQTPLYVSRGIGTSVLPVRLWCRPEITLLRLKSSLPV
jgi:predicted MPP superfamily phosphohydrolase